MGRRGSISRKAWQRAVNALLWYPDNREEFASLADEFMHRGLASGADDPTGDAAIRLVEDRRYQTLKQEIEAVELAVSSLHPEQAEIIRRRFWDSRHYGKTRKPRQYDFLQDSGYSIEGMKWIAKQTILLVAAYLGEK